MSGPAGPHALARVRRVRVGSTNAPKIAAVRSALGAYAPEAHVEGVPVASDVPEQPLGFEEIVHGARTRAARAAQAAPCDLAVGIEDGLVPLPPLPGLDAAPGHVNIGCAAVTDGRRVSIGFSSGFAYPPACALPAVRERRPIGAVFDRFWAERRGADPDAGRVGPGAGNVGRLSLGALPRGEYARHAVLCALVGFLHPDLYPLEVPAA